MSSFGTLAPAGASTEGFSLSSASQPGQSTITWQNSPNTWPDPITLNGQIDSATGQISGASLGIPSLSEVQEGENVTFAFSEVHPGTATGSFDSATGAATLTDTLQLKFSVLSYFCVSTPIQISLSGTWDSATQNVTLATTSSFTIPQFPVTNNCLAAIAQGLNAPPPNGVTGSTGNAMSFTLHGQFAPGLPTTTTLTTNVTSPQPAGTSVTLTAVVADPSDAGTPTGPVTFLDNGASIGTGTLDGTGTATFTTTSLPGGDNQLVASYPGDPNYAASTSSAVPLTIQPYPSITANWPAAVTLGTTTTPFTLAVTNPAQGQSYDGVYLDISLSGINQGASGAANRPTISYQDSGGNWCPLTYATTSTSTYYVYFPGFGTAPCGAPPASTALPAGGAITVPLELSYPSAGVGGTQTITATLYTGSCTSPTACTATAPLSGNAAPSGTGYMQVNSTTQVTPTFTTSSATQTTVAAGNTLNPATGVATATHTAAPTGTLTYVLNGQVLSFINSAGQILTVNPDPLSSTSVRVMIPADTPPGDDVLTVNYSGDVNYLPGSTTLPITVLAPSAGTPYSCTQTALGAIDPLAANIVVQQGNLPLYATSGTAVPINNLIVTVNGDLNLFATGTVNTGATFGLSPTATVTSTATTPATKNVTTNVTTATWGGLAGMTTVTGDVGDQVPVSLDSLVWSIGSGLLEKDYSCTANPDQATVIGTVTITGNTLAASPSGSADPGTPVTLIDTVSPASIVSTPSSGVTKPVGGQVTFYDGTAEIGTALVDTSTNDPTFGTASIVTNTLSVGMHQLTAYWSGNLSVPGSTSNEVDYQVGSTSTTTLASSSNPANAAHPVTFTATVNGPQGATTQPTGDVSFTEDGNPITTCQDVGLSTATPPKATCSISLPAGQTHAIVATYSGDGNYLGSSSATLTQTTSPGTVTSILSTKDPSPPGNVTFWSGVTPAGSGATPTGTVAFSIDGSVYKACSAQPLGSGGGASCTVSFKANTSHKVFATYAGSTSYSGSKSATITQTVTGGSGSTGPKTTGGSATLNPGQTLTANQSISTGSYKLVMQSDGNLVEYQGTKALWASGTAGHPGTKVAMQTDGNLVEYQGGHAIWASNTAGHPGAHLTLQGADGNVVIYQGTTALWATGT